MAGLSPNVGGWLRGWGGARSPGFRGFNPRPVGGSSGERLVTGIPQPSGLRLGVHGGPVRSTAPARAYPTTPPAAAPAPAPTPAAAPPNYPSPYDAQYFSDLGTATDLANQKIAGLNANIQNGQTNLQSTLAQLAKNQVLQQQNAQLSENARGGFAQGALGEQEGKIAQAAQTTQSNDQRAYSQNVANWNAAIAGVRQGLSDETIALGIASTGRVAARGLAATPDGGGQPNGGGQPAAPTGGGRPGGHAPAGGPRPLSVTLQPRSSHPAPRGRGGPRVRLQPRSHH